MLIRRASLLSDDVFSDGVLSDGVLSGDLVDIRVADRISEIGHSLQPHDDEDHVHLSRRSPAATRSTAFPEARPWARRSERRQSSRVNESGSLVGLTILEGTSFTAEVRGCTVSFGV